jgi:hypothetical protein
MTYDHNNPQTSSSFSPDWNRLVKIFEILDYIRYFALGYGCNRRKVYV